MKYFYPGELPICGLHLLRLPPNSVILEIGANDGHHTEQFRSAFPRATIHAFEPDPRAFALLKHRCEKLEVTLHHKAVAEKNGLLSFYPSSGAPPGHESDFPEGWHQSGSLRRPKQHITAVPWCSFRDPVKVESVTLDDWSKANGIAIIDFLWIDVQGAEDAVIRGGSEILQQAHFLYTEYSNSEMYENQPTLEAILALLPDWEIHTLYESDVLLRNKAFKKNTETASSFSHSAGNQSVPTILAEADAMCNRLDHQAAAEQLSILLDNPTGWPLTSAQHNTLESIATRLFISQECDDSTQADLLVSEAIHIHLPKDKLRAISWLSLRSNIGCVKVCQLGRFGNSIRRKRHMKHPLP